MGVARTFQNIRLFKELTVEDNVKIGLHNAFTYNRWPARMLPHAHSYWTSERKAHETALELLSIFDMQNARGAESGFPALRRAAAGSRLSARSPRARSYCCWTSPPRA